MASQCGGLPSSTRGSAPAHLNLLMQTVAGYQLRYTIHSTQRKQQYGLCLRKFVHTDLPQAGFALGSLGPQVGMLQIEPSLLVASFFFAFGGLFEN